MSNNLTKFTTYPVVDEIMADTVFPTLEKWKGETVTISAEYIEQDPGDYFILKVKGNSMYPIYRDGDKILVLKQDTLDYSGQEAAVVYGDETAMLCKVNYRKNEDFIYLEPITPNSMPKEIKGSNTEQFHILGIPKLLLYRKL